MEELWKLCKICKGTMNNRPYRKEKTMSNNRMQKVNEELKREISNIISLKLSNSLLRKGLISVTKVDTSPDLKYARVYVSMINIGNKKEALKALKKSSGFVRTEIAQKVNLKYTPELIFEFDESIEYGDRIDNILKEITKEIKKNEE